MTPSEQIAALLEVDKQGNYCCPFCWGTNVQLDEWSMYNDGITCKDCYAWGPIFKEFDNGEKAIKAWNTRAYLPAMRQMVRDIKSLRNAVTAFQDITQGLTRVLGVSEKELEDKIQEILTATQHYEGL